MAIANTSMAKSWSEMCAKSIMPTFNRAWWFTF
jgi:hypothetical protein